MIKVLFNGRTSEIRTDAQNPRVFMNNTGLPQGAILLPTLCNFVMPKITKALRDLPHLQPTIYADDISKWVKTRYTLLDERDVVASVQRGLDVTDACHPATGMRLSPDKTKFVVIKGLDHMQVQVHLMLNGRPVQRASDRWVRILDVPLHEDGGATEWLQQLKLL